jgi:Fe-S cluster assembly iron-binding protein IscA
MITLTERAATELEELLTTNNAPPGQGLKLVPGRTGQVGMIIGAPSEGDEVVRRGDEPLLIVDSSIAGALDGAKIDCETAVVDGQPKAEFRLEPPAPPAREA